MRVCRRRRQLWREEERRDRKIRMPPQVDLLDPRCKRPRQSAPDEQPRPKQQIEIWLELCGVRRQNWRAVARRIGGDRPLRESAKKCWSRDKQPVENPL